jgi:hypothetical protein
MTKPRIYVETTIPSAYSTSRSGANAQLGLPVPLITTPRRLLGGEDELA